MSNPPIKRFFIQKYGEAKGKVGKGAYGVVRKFMYNGEEIAGKAIKLYRDEDMYLDESSYREATILRRMNHQHVINLLDVSEDKKDLNKIFLLMPLAAGSLDKILESNQVPHNHPKMLSFKKDITFQMISSISYLASIDVIHGDIKLENFLFFKGGSVKLADFGLSRALSCSKIYDPDNVAYTSIYRPAEIFLGGRVTLKCDVWALGVTIYNLYNSSDFGLLFTDSEADLFDILNVLGNPLYTWKEVVKYPRWNSFQQFLGRKLTSSKVGVINWEKGYLDNYLNGIVLRMLTYNPDIRPHAFEIGEDPYFNDVRTVQLERVSTCREALAKRMQIIKMPKAKLVDFMTSLNLFIYQRKGDTVESDRWFFYYVDLYDKSIDIVLDPQNRPKDYNREAKILSAACITIAIVEKDPGSIQFLDVIKLFGNEFELEELRIMIKTLISFYSYDFVFSSPFDFIESAKKEISDQIFNHAIDLLFMSLSTDLRFKHNAQILGESCIRMAFIATGHIEHCNDLNVIDIIDTFFEILPNMNDSYLALYNRTYHEKFENIIERLYSLCHE